MAVPVRGLKFHRRTALRGLSAATVAIFGSAVTRSMAGAQDGGNLVVFYTPNGMVREHFGADGSESNFTLRSSLSALAPIKNRISVIENIHNMTYVDQGSHGAVTRILTCETGSDAAIAVAPSIDHVLAKGLGDTPLYLRVLPWPNGALSTTFAKLSWPAAGVAAVAEDDPRAVFNRIFPKVDTGGDSNAAALHNRRERRILDAVRGDLSTLRGRLDSTGRSLLDIHATSLNELEKSLIVPETSTGDGCTVDGLMNDLAEPLPAKGPSSTASRDWRPYMEAHGHLQMDIIAHAIACGLKRVATLHTQPCSLLTVNVEGTNASAGHHHVSHWHNDPPANLTQQQAKNQTMAMDAYHARQYLYLMQKLDSLGVLGDTFVPWVSDIQEHHMQKNYTLVVGGGENQGVRTGRFFKYPQETSRHPYGDLSNNSFNDLWVTAHRVVGVAPKMSGGKMVFGEAKYCKGKGNVDLLP